MIAPYSLINLIKKENPNETERLTRFLLGKLADFPIEFYSHVNDYDDGLAFVQFCYDILSPKWKVIVPEDRQKYDITLICVKLEMLDRLTRWEEYVDYFKKMSKRNYQCIYNKTASHLKIDRASPYILGEDKDYIYVHFLYLLLPRFEAICKYLKQFPLGSKKRSKLKPRPVPPIDKLNAQFSNMEKRFQTLLGIDENVVRVYEKNR